MKKYECLYIVNINYDSEGISAVVARIEEILKNLGAEVKNTQHWGKRKLAYAIDKERYGNYVLLHFEGENPDITELQREFEIESSVLHYMTIRLDEFPDFDTLSVPQTIDAERKRPGSSGGRGHYDDDGGDRDNRGGRGRYNRDDAEVEPVAEKGETKAADVVEAEVVEKVELAAEEVETEVEEEKEESLPTKTETPAEDAE